MVGLFVLPSPELLNSTKQNHWALCRAEEQYVSPSTERKIQRIRYQIQGWREKEEMCISMLISQSSSSCLHPEGGGGLPVPSSTVRSLLYLIYLAASGLRHVGFSLRHAGSLVPEYSLVLTLGTLQVHYSGPAAPTACRVLVPWPGIGPVSLELQRGFLTTGPPAKSPHYISTISFTATSVHSIK